MEQFLMVSWCMPPVGYFVTAVSQDFGSLTKETRRYCCYPQKIFGQLLANDQRIASKCGHAVNLCLRLLVTLCNNAQRLLGDLCSNMEDGPIYMEKFFFNENPRLKLEVPVVT